MKTEVLDGGPLTGVARHVSRRVRRRSLFLTELTEGNRIVVSAPAGRRRRFADFGVSFFLCDLRVSVRFIVWIDMCRGVVRRDPRVLVHGRQWHVVHLASARLNRAWVSLLCFVERLGRSTTLAVALPSFTR